MAKERTITADDAAPNIYGGHAERMWSYNFAEAKAKLISLMAQATTYVPSLSPDHDGTGINELGFQLYHLWWRFGYGFVMVQSPKGQADEWSENGKRLYHIRWVITSAHGGGKLTVDIGVVLESKQTKRRIGFRMPIAEDKRRAMRENLEQWAMRASSLVEPDFANSPAPPYTHPRVSSRVLTISRKTDYRQQSVADAVELRRGLESATSKVVCSALHTIRDYSKGFTAEEIAYLDGGRIGAAMFSRLPQAQDGGSEAEPEWLPLPWVAEVMQQDASAIRKRLKEVGATPRISPKSKKTHEYRKEDIIRACEYEAAWIEPLNLLRRALASRTDCG